MTAQLFQRISLAVVLGLFVQSQLHAQVPKQFEIYYDVGTGPVHDSFDSEKKTRTIDAVRGPFSYTAELTNEEKQQLYDAILQNNLLAMKTDFTNTGSVSVMPASRGRLRVNIDGQVKDIRFNAAYGLQFRNPRDFLDTTNVVNSPESEEWTRFSNIRKIIEAILKAKDEKQTLPARNMYF